MEIKRKNFDYNIKICNNPEKIVVKKITSDKFFEDNDMKYDLIYIDGSHECSQINKDNYLFGLSDIEVGRQYKLHLRTGQIQQHPSTTSQTAVPHGKDRRRQRTAENSGKHPPVQRASA